MVDDECLGDGPVDPVGEAHAHDVFGERLIVGDRPALDAEGEPMVGYTFFTLIFDIKGTYERDGSRTYGDAGGRTVRKQGDY